MHLRGSWLALLPILAPAAVQAKGANCEGSKLCSWRASDTLSEVVDALKFNLDDATLYTGDLQQLACTGVGGIGGGGAICAFLQRTADKPKVSFTGAELKALGQQILDNGCDSCGSVPVDPAVNDIDVNGELTINYVSEPWGAERYVCIDRPADGMEILERPDRTTWIGALLDKMWADRIPEDTVTTYPVEKPIACVAVGQTEGFIAGVIQGAVCAVPHSTPNGVPVTSADVWAMARGLADAGCDNGGQYAANGKPIMNTNGWLGVEFFEAGKCPA